MFKSSEYSCGSGYVAMYVTIYEYGVDGDSAIMRIVDPPIAFFIGKKGWGGDGRLVLRGEEFHYMFAFFIYLFFFGGGGGGGEGGRGESTTF